MFNEYLKNARLKKGLSMREVSSRSGVSQPYISQLESGTHTTPKRNITKRLAEVLEVDEQEMFIHSLDLKIGDIQFIKTNL